jgi:hypothetical protein
MSSRFDGRSYSATATGASNTTNSGNAPKLPHGSSPKKPAISTSSSGAYQLPSKRAGANNSNTSTGSGSGGGGGGGGGGRREGHYSTSVGGRKPAGSSHPPLPRPVDREPW